MHPNRTGRPPGRPFSAVLSLFLACLPPAACGGDDDDDHGAAAVCGAACSGVGGTCLPVATLEANCSAACQIGYTLVPGCAGQYEAALACVGGRPFVQCTPDSVIVSAKVLECAGVLAGYLECVAGAVVPACIALPLGDATCQEQGQPPHAYACAGAPEGCLLSTGTNLADGIGTFCCP